MSSSRSDPSDLEVAPTLLTRAVAGFGTSILGGAALGVTAWFSDQLGYPLGLLIPANAIGVWLAVAFALGGSARTLPTGASATSSTPKASAAPTNRRGVASRADAAPDLGEGEPV
mgnify:CR=1 FL=1